MRSAAIVLATLILGISGISAPVSPVHAAEFGTREDAMAMVRRVQEKFRKDGIDATIRAADAKTPGFTDRDLYVMLYSMDGTCLANGNTPAVRGKNMYDLKDQDGKYMIHEFVSVASNPPFRGWVDYRWPNAATKTIEDKSTWVERMGDYIVGVGVYKNEQPNETIGVISGSPNSDDTYLQMAYDLADVLNDHDDLRILPIAGVGGPRNIRDVRYLRGVDIGLTQTNILNSFRRSNERMGQSDNHIVYVAKLFNEEVHLVARRDITSIEQLKGRKVNLDAKASGTSYSMRDLFKTYGIEVEEVSMSQLEGLAKVKSGEIAATALIAGKPVRSMSRLTRNDGLHFVPLPYPTSLIADYLPAVISHDDYPELVPQGETVDTVAVGAVMIAYDWPKANTERYGRVVRFVDAFFSNIGEFQKPPHHPKWREVNLAAALPGWNRLPAAQQWLDSKGRQNLVIEVPASASTTAVSTVARTPAVRVPAPTPARGTEADPRPASSTLFEDFLRWRQGH